jgi:hypothetical protein
MRSKALSEHTPINGTPKIHAILSPAKSVAVIMQGNSRISQSFKNFIFLSLRAANQEDLL